MTLAGVWTLVVMGSGWLELPRAQHMPHDPQFVSKLSREAASILLRTDATEKPARGALIWSGNPRIARMPNGTDLTLPAITTGEEVAFVASEYYRLLSNAASERRTIYLLEMLAIWLVPGLCLLIAGYAMRLLNGGRQSFNWANPVSQAPAVQAREAQTTVAVGASGYVNDGEIMASRTTHGAAPSF